MNPSRQISCRHRSRLAESCHPSSEVRLAHSVGAAELDGSPAPGRGLAGRGPSMENERRSGGRRVPRGGAACRESIALTRAGSESAIIGSNESTPGARRPHRGPAAPHPHTTTHTHPAMTPAVIGSPAASHAGWISPACETLNPAAKNALPRRLRGNRNGARGLFHIDRSTRHRMLMNRQIYLMYLPAILTVIVFNLFTTYGLKIAWLDFNFQDGLNSPSIGWEYFRVAVRHATVLSPDAEHGGDNLPSPLFGFPVVILLALLLNDMRSKALKNASQSVLYLPHFLNWVIIATLLYMIFNEALRGSEPSVRRRRPALRGHHLEAGMDPRRPHRQRHMEDHGLEHDHLPRRTVRRRPRSL